MILINSEVAATIGVDRLLDHFKRDFRVQRMTRIAIIDGGREILNTQPPISQTHPPTLKICFRRKAGLLSITSRTSAVFWWNSRTTGSIRFCHGCNRARKPR